jgi:probable selenium-dependent hydroxylase accessory protein YqeC
MVGGGGKTAALHLLARELAGPARRVLVTTTTAMLQRELEQAGPLVMAARLPVLLAELRRTLADAGLAAAAYAPGDQGKVVGLPGEWVDELWAAALANYLIVEADGSRGRPLKLFGPHEPQVPASTTTIVQVAGLDAIGALLDEEHVHRAALVAAALHVPLDSVITSRLLADCLREQGKVLRRRWPEARVVAMLNKADGPGEQVTGSLVAEELLAASPQKTGVRAPDRGPDAVVVASMRERRYVRVCRSGG